jgi:hypothetical protein
LAYDQLHGATATRAVESTLTTTRATGIKRDMGYLLLTQLPAKRDIGGVYPNLRVRTCLV